ncbi:dihydrofolate reductase family protein [Dyadobacter sp. CY347]|uniref:dihydrofolate reductase family protein n=1 Tax=Dyadobacter sp. CY347 TaxID=2909336 RepID=UPI001F1DDA66|nr:dihydrofolate reductase family protein [Dyadobacter sp. CY347]MCF2489106.1 dihydrofolate reductase family protein [Dyadobacter sp. CY347]
MRKIITNTFMTLDGVMQAPGGPDEDTESGFEYGGWSVTQWDQLMNEAMIEAMKKPYDLLLGRVTYEIFAAHWPTLKDDPTADLFNRINKYVATNSLTDTAWENTVLLNQDTIEQIKNLKLTEGIDLQVHGSGNLIQSLLRHGLIDQMNIWIYPLVIGKGKRLFGEGTVPANFKLVKHIVSTTGVIITSFEQNGKVPIGSFAS